MMEHKAFVFDFEAFDRELRPILEAALHSGDPAGAVAFIAANLHDLLDPYEGEPLPDDWESTIEVPDVHQYGDFALTKYYDPAADIGLGAEWMDLQDRLAASPDGVESPLLGFVIGPRHAPFDPGKMGSYFRSAAQVRRDLELLSTPAEIGEDANRLRCGRMLEQAVQVGKGLYVTF